MSPEAAIRESPASGSFAGRLATGLELLALLVVLLVVAVRPLISETYDSGIQQIVAAAGGPEVASPATTAWFDLAIWAAALAGVAAAMLKGSSWRWTGAEGGWLLLVLAAVVSSLGASNQRLATNASGDWLTIAAMLFIIVNVCRQRWRVCLLLAVIFASGIASASKSAMQVGWEFREMRAEYQQHRSEFWGRQGVDLDDPRVALFERRMATDQGTGFFPHSNTEAGLLCLAGFAGLALASAGGSRPARFGIGLLALLVLGMTITTRSKGGIAAVAAGGLCYVALSRWGPALRRKWRAVLAAGWGLVLALVGLVILIGVVRGGLPGSSLGFRWQYWTVTRQVIAEHLWNGVGALNFDGAYLAVKPIDYPEEIKDPHNFVLSVLAQWGLVGGLGLIVALAGYTFVAARAWGCGEEAQDDGTSRAPLRWLAALVIGFVALRIWLFRGYLPDPGGRALVLFDLGSFGLLWVAAVGASLWAVQSPHAGKIALACFCGCAAFLLHNAIEFSIFYPGTLTPFVAMAGALLAALPEPESAPARPRRATLALTLAAGACIVAVITVVLIPVSRCTAWLSLARASAESNPQEADRSYAAAAEADPYDPTPWFERAVLRTRSGSLQDLDLAATLVEGAIARHRSDLSLYHLQSRVYEVRYRAADSPTDLLAAIGALREALRLYPSSPDEHLSLADLLGRLAAETQSPELAAESVDQYREALRLNDARPGTDEVRRWTPEQRARIEQHLQAVQSLGASPGTAPASLPRETPSYNEIAARESG